MIDMTPRDFRQQVCGAYVTLSPCAAAPFGTPAYVVSTEDDGPEEEEEAPSDFLFITDSGNFHLKWKDVVKTVNIGFPDAVLFNHNNKMLMFTRRIVKQFHKAPSESNSTIQDVTVRMLPNKRRYRKAPDLPNDYLSLSLPLWTALCRRVYPDIANAYDLLVMEQSTASVAVSEEYGLLASVLEQDVKLPVIHFSTHIGYLTRKRAKFRAYQTFLTPISSEFSVDLDDFGHKFLTGKQWTLQAPSSR